MLKPTDEQREEIRHRFPEKRPVPGCAAVFVLSSR